MRNIRLNASKIVLALFNTLLSLVLFFALRRFLLRLVGVRVGDGVTVHRAVRMFGFGRMVIGDWSTINYGCFLDNRAGIAVGRNVNISHCVKIYSMGHDVNDPLCSLVKRPVVIEDKVWIFPNALIMPGVTLSEGAVVYPGSVVVKDVAPYAIVGGNPARVIGERNRNIKYKLDFSIWFAI
jgi:acetyltransferase-like isoleucine patch superfamily enzyme